MQICWWLYMHRRRWPLFECLVVAAFITIIAVVVIITIISAKVGCQLLNHNCPPISINLGGNSPQSRPCKWFLPGADGNDINRIIPKSYWVLMKVCVQIYTWQTNKGFNFGKNPYIGRGMHSTPFKKLRMNFDEISCADRYNVEEEWFILVDNPKSIQTESCK